MAKEYVVFTNLSASHVNAISGAYVYGLVGAPAIAALGHALQRRLAKHFNLTVTGTAIAIQSFDILDSLAATHRYQDSKITPVIVEKPVADMRFSLVFEIEPLQADPAVLTAAMRLALLGLRLAGGPIFQCAYSGPRYCVDTETSEALEQALSYLPGGAFLLTDESAYLREQTDPELKGLDHLVTKIWSYPGRDEPKVVKPYYVPLHVGYRGIEETPVLRKISRLTTSNEQGLAPHVCVEPVIGLGRLQTVNSVRLTYRENAEYQPNVFWNLTPYLNGYLLASAERV